MNLSALSVKQLEEIMVLLRERESIQSKLDKVISDLNQFERGPASVIASIGIQGSNRRLRRRGSLEKVILKTLKSAGAKGLTVNELALQAKVKRSSLNTWLYTAGKKIAGLKKLAPGTFAYIP